MLPVLAFGYVFFETGAEVAPNVIPLGSFEQGLHDEQGWYAHENGCIATLHLLVELWELLLSAPEQLAELV